MNDLINEILKKTRERLSKKYNNIDITLSMVGLKEEIKPVADKIEFTKCLGNGLSELRDKKRGWILPLKKEELQTLEKNIYPHDKFSTLFKKLINETLQKEFEAGIFTLSHNPRKFGFTTGLEPDNIMIKERAKFYSSIKKEIRLSLN